MRKDSLIVFATSIVLTLGIIGGAHYLYLQDQKLIPDEPVVKPQAVTGAVQTKSRMNQPAKRRTAKIIQCTQPDGSVFWTNANRCEDADLNNTLSYYDHVTPAPRVRTSNLDQRKPKAKRLQVANSGNKRLKSIPWKMNNACSFAIGKAQQIEKRSLRLKDDPSESSWKNSYCRWVCEARAENCEDIEDYLGMTRLCPRKNYPDKSYCNN